MVFLKFVFEKVYFEKNQQTTKSMENFPGGKELSFLLNFWVKKLISVLMFDAVLSLYNKPYYISLFDITQFSNSLRIVLECFSITLFPPFRPEVLITNTFHIHTYIASLTLISLHNFHSEHLLNCVFCPKNTQHMRVTR